MIVIRRLKGCGWEADPELDLELLHELLYYVRRSTSETRSYYSSGPYHAITVLLAVTIHPTSALFNVFSSLNVLALSGRFRGWLEAKVLAGYVRLDTNTKHTLFLLVMDA